MVDNALYPPYAQDSTPTNPYLAPWAKPNALDPAAAYAAANWLQGQGQQQNPSFWQMLLHLIGLGRQQQPVSNPGAFFAGGGGPRYVIGGGPAVPQARPLSYESE